LKTVNINLPSNPIVHTFLTGWDITTSGWTMGIYSDVNSIDTISNTVKLNFTAIGNNIWKNACGFVIAFSNTYFNKKG
jgi:hypothetical protein